MSNMEKRAIMQPVNALLPGAGFATEKLLAPRQALVAFFSCVRIASPSIERVSLDDAFGRVLARLIEADDEYPNATRSAMDGFALLAAATPGDFAIAGEVHMGEAPDASITPTQTLRIPTGGVLPPGADAVVPIEDALVDDSIAHVAAGVEAGANVVARGADMHRGEAVLKPGTRIGAPQAGVLAALGVTEVDVYRRPIVAVFSSGDELVAPSMRPKPGQVRDSNRYAISASLRAMKPTRSSERYRSRCRNAMQSRSAAARRSGSAIAYRTRSLRWANRASWCMGCD
jgi:molybdopterin biosynthesis enzyme